MGTFSIGEAKIRPGEYHRYENAGGMSTTGAVNGIVAGIIRANWGPLNKTVVFAPSTSVAQTFGTGMTEDLITEMFKSGSSKGYFVRCGTGGTCGEIVLKDDEASDVVAISAKYVGDRAFSITIRDSLTNTSKRECIVFDGTTEFEKIEFAKNAADGEAAALVDAFAKSVNFTASVLSNGSGVLAGVTQSEFKAGTNPTVNAEAYSNALAALEPYIYNVLCVYTEDTDIHALVSAFLKRTYAAGSYPMAVLSEKSTIDLEARMTNAKTFNDEKCIYVLYVAEYASGNVREGYLNAARIGGIVAYVPSNQSVTHYVINDYAGLSESLTNTQIENALLAGCLVLTVNSNGQVWIEQGINTLVDPSEDQDEGWKKIRRVKTRYELMQRVGDTTAKLVGKVDNDTDGRAAIVAAGQAIIDEMIAEKKLRSGSKMMEDEANPAIGDSAWFVIAVDDIDSIEKFYLTYRFRFSAED